MSHMDVPVEVWQGPFKQIAETLDKPTWEVWAGTLAALGAIAHRNIHFTYYNPLFAMCYVLLVGETGSGKTLATSLCRNLLPDWYKVARGIQSGQALLPILATVKRAKSGEVESVETTPAILILEEWTRLATATQYSFSTLLDDLNALWHEPLFYDLSKAESQGGRVVVQKPIFSLLGTTTRAALGEALTPAMIARGFLNRHLVLPGTARSWAFHENGHAGKSPSLCRGMLDYLLGRAWGAGEDIWHVYKQDALDYMVVWGSQLFEPLMNDKRETPVLLAGRRLHVYAHIISLIYAYAELSPRIQLPHVIAASKVIECSLATIHDLLDDPPLPQTLYGKNKSALEEKILATIKKIPGISKRELQQKFHRHADLRAIAEAAEALVTAGIIAVECTRPRTYIVP